MSPDSIEQGADRNFIKDLGAQIRQRADTL